MDTKISSGRVRLSKNVGFSHLAFCQVSALLYLFYATLEQKFKLGTQLDLGEKLVKKLLR